MPFIKLVDRHTCAKPLCRDDGSVLSIGDEWQCDQTLTDGSGLACARVFRWTDAQIDGPYWAEVTG